jgi:hypothetical protein
MEVHLSPELEAQLNQVVKETGRAADDLVQDVMTGYFAERIQVRGMLERRFDDVASGHVKAIDGEEFFETLRRREDDLLEQSKAR